MYCTNLQADLSALRVQTRDSRYDDGFYNVVTSRVTQFLLTHAMQSKVIRSNCEQLGDRGPKQCDQDKLRVIH